jgi:prepilin-type N-terminal cleavage/methylation domain-containing protein
MEKRNIVKNQKGFTLIEIIAVLVILGILAAVAVPKFVNLQADAKEKAIQGALAAGGSTVAMVFAQQVLKTGAAVSVGDTVTALGVTTVSDFTNVGDFTVSYAAGASPNAATHVLVTVTAGPVAKYLDGVTVASLSKEFGIL